MRSAGIKMRLYVLIAVEMIILGVYLYTVQPSLSFWDAGERIACGYSLGVPHPPGTPLHVIICKIFSLIPFGREIGFRVNMLSVISGVLCGMFVWHTLMKVISLIKPITTKRDEFIASIGASSGALISAFSYTTWWNSVETETYGIATALFMLCIWLAFKWDENIKTGSYIRYLLLLIYVLALSVGVQLIPFLAAPGIFVFAFLRDRKEFKSNRLLYIGAISIPFFALCSSVPLPLVGILAVGALVLVFYPKKGITKEYNLYATIALLFILGFLSYGVLLVRAHHNPMINEAAPTDMQKLWDVFSRKQYGPNKASAIIVRETATADNKYNIFQAYVYQVKFFTDYLLWQWAPYPRQERWEEERLSSKIKFGSVIFSAMLICFGLFGMYSHFKQERATFWLIFISFMFVTFMFIVYMNFKFSPSDPNPLHRHAEVRERHYFFEPAFVLFAWYIGLGIWSLLDKIKKGWQITVPVALVLLAISFVPLFANFNSHANRRGNWIPDDYGYNLLHSCEDKSVLFTNGDNDTFPLWFAQIVKNIKPSVKVANLSLLNTDWYMKQLRSWGAPISLTDFQIDNLMAPIPIVKNGEAVEGKFLYVKDIGLRDIIATNGGYKFEAKLFLPIKRSALPKEHRAKFPKNMEIIPPNYYVRRLPQKYWMRIPEEYLLPNDEFANLVLKDYKSRNPVYFAVTVSRDNFAGFESALMMQAMVWKVVPLEDGGFDAIATDSLLNKVYKYRSFFEPNVYKSENDKKLITNYAASFFQLALAKRDIGKYDEAIQSLEFAKKLQTGGESAFSYQLASLYGMSGQHEKLTEYLSTLEQTAQTDQEWYAIGELYMKAGNKEKAQETYEKILALYPNDPSYGYLGFIKLYWGTRDNVNLDKLIYQIIQSPSVTGKVASILRFEQQNELVKLILQAWLARYPGDTVARDFLLEIP